MNSLFKKELKTFFGSVTGYLVIALFLLTTGLFLWVIPGEFNLLDRQRASLEGLFNFAPWIYLFLIPAITMRMIAEEKRTGTIELLLTRPLSPGQIVAAKYLAALVLIGISLLPTLVYWLTIVRLGNPAGNIDAGATLGSFIGLFLLASVYTAIGLWSSALANNQVIAFLIAIFVSFLFYLGFDFAASAGLPFRIQSILLKTGINEHYQSISRGVIDSRDLVYYLATTLLFLILTRTILLPAKKKFSPKKTTLLALMLLVSVGLVNFRLFRIDLTAGHRYSLSPITKNILKQQENIVYVEIYLTGELPAGMNEFKDAITEKLEDLNAYAPKRIFYKTQDINSITPLKTRESIIRQLSELGIQPVSFNYNSNEGLSVKQIFPGVLIQYGDKKIGLDLLKRDPMLPGDENLRQSIELLEFRMAKAFRHLFTDQKPVVAFLSGQGEASEAETGDLRMTLNENYQVKDVTCQQLNSDSTIGTLIVADPTREFSTRDKFVIDQFIMKGGKMLCCIDPVYCQIDSLSKGFSTIAFGVDLNLTDLLFKYGIRLEPVLLQDVVCAQYPVNTAPAGQPTQWVPAPFYYSPLAQPSNQHPLSRNLGYVKTEFPSMLELVGHPGTFKVEPILSTSTYSRIVNTPVEVNLISATMPPDRKLFNRSCLPIGAIAEGQFESLYKNRLTENLEVGHQKPIAQSPETKLIVIADGNLIKNKVSIQGQNIQIQPLGYDQYSGQLFGNRDFLVNCIDYLNDQEGLMSLRTRVIQLRLLDKVVIRENRRLVQLINVVAPILLILLVGILFQMLRTRKYSRTKND